MNRYRLVAVAASLVLWMGVTPLLAAGEQQARRRAGRDAAAARAPEQRSAPRARRPAAPRAPARPAAARSARERPRGASPAGRRDHAERGAADVASGRAARVRRTADAVDAGSGGAVRVRRTADAVRRAIPRPPNDVRQRRPVERDRRRSGAGAATRAVPRTPGRSGAGPGYRDRRGGDHGYRRGRDSRGRDREYRRGRDYRRGYGRRYARSQRPGYWYGWSHRYGYGYHRLRSRHHHWGVPHGHVHYPGYTHRHLYGSYFFAPGFSFALGFGSRSAAFFPGYGYYAPYASGYYGAHAYHPTDLHTGFLRLKVRPRYAQVFVDGYFVGVVNEFDGVFQRLRLEEGPHQVEVVHAGFEPLELDVLIVPGEKVTFEGDLIPLP